MAGPVSGADPPWPAIRVRYIALGTAILWFFTIIAADADVGGNGRSPLARAGPVILVMLILYVYGSYGIAKGRNGRRILMTIMMVPLYFVMLPYCLPMSSGNAMGMSALPIDIVAVLLSVGSLVLAYLPATNAHIRSAR